ncbi:Uu.00g076150.m01.CDS01 [Anthostomella pinea]|uniref:Uu.00g076150.m01.CDS01 n=1 Tax=Anthostomella pinea TaxID=933095 RepID=A0AAI8YP91_9PEZI|nr:Uu.00g076150.m01.CDS01 [Anthostomella pinea]
MAVPVLVDVSNLQVDLDDDYSLKEAISIVESEIADRLSDTESQEPCYPPSLKQVSAQSDTIQETFNNSKTQWIDDPIISQWRSPHHRIHDVLSEINDLHTTWRSRQLQPFSPSSDDLWLQTGRVLAEVGLPWHNNQINMPNEIDTSWPFHFKSFETKVLQAKGARVGDPNPSGYVCSSSEANLYCIRALQQELREIAPTQRPLLVYDHFDISVLESVESFFGLETHHVDLSEGEKAIMHYLKDVTCAGARPIIFAATLANQNGVCDDMGLICKITEKFPLILHVDASRNFDYITTLSENGRTRLEIEKFTLGVKPLKDSVRAPNGSILVSTIVAGSSSHASWAPAAALKPASLGEKQARVAYIRASDSTLAGSRDALAPLWMALQEMRLGESGFRQVYEHCAGVRAELLRALESWGISAITVPYSLDILLKRSSAVQMERLAELGGIVVNNGDVMLTVRPNVKPSDIESVIEIMSLKPRPADHLAELPPYIDFSTLYPIPQTIIGELKAKVQSWKIATRSATGYPFHMGSYSALGPVVGRFLDINIPQDCIKTKADEVLTARLSAFGLRMPEERSLFKGAFTNGSTMGNRVGIHVALKNFRGAVVYFSAETHYSVAKTARDCDGLTNRWSGSGPRYSQIPCGADGSILVDALVRQAVEDKKRCLERGDSYRMVLFANMGTTFVGARDDITRIHDSLAKVGIAISYIHVDGALDFGFDNCGIRLGPPGSQGPDGTPMVQGVTLSHHKALGHTVSGEVLCFSPRDELPSLAASVDPRAVFETWLYSRIYAPDDVGQMLNQCQDNAAHLEARLRRIGVVTKRNPQSIITVFERPPAWIIEEFSLRPEGDWVHFIAMPHVSRETVDLFVERIAWVDRQCEVAFSYVAPLFEAALLLPVKLRRLQCRNPLTKKVAELDISVGSGDSPDTVIKAILRGALSVAVLDADDRLQAVILVDSARDKSMHAGPVLLGSYHRSNSAAVVDIAKQLVGFMGRHMDAMLRVDDRSNVVYNFCDRGYSS